MTWSMKTGKNVEFGACLSGHPLGWLPDFLRSRGSWFLSKQVMVSLGQKKCLIAPCMEQLGANAPCKSSFAKTQGHWKEVIMIQAEVQPPQVHILRGVHRRVSHCLWQMWVSPLGVCCSLEATSGMWHTKMGKSQTPCPMCQRVARVTTCWSEVPKPSEATLGSHLILLPRLGL